MSYLIAFVRSCIDRVVKIKGTKRAGIQIFVLIIRNTPVLFFTVVYDHVFFCKVCFIK